MGITSSASHTSDPEQLNEEERAGASIHAGSSSSSSSSSSSTEDDSGPIVPVSSKRYYDHYFGHRISELEDVLRNLRRLGKDQIIFLVGDSSLDNKYWLRGRQPACTSYSQFLEPPTSVPDVAYWLNVELEQRGYTRTAVVNAAIEESTLGDRQSNSLRKQDFFVRDHIRPSDIIIMSVGGNDIALKPTPQTIFNILKLVKMNSLQDLQDNPRSCWGMPYFEAMFHSDLLTYVNALTAKTVPAAVVPSMIYFPDETASGSWADRALGPLGYDKEPEILQTAIRQMFSYITQNVRSEGVPLFPMALFEALDGKTTGDYVARVEPSLSGGHKMACAYLDLLASKDVLLPSRLDSAEPLASSSEQS